MIIVIVLRNNRYAPAAVVLIALGITLMAFWGELKNLKGVELVKFARDMRWSLELVPMAATVAVSAPCGSQAAGLVSAFKHGYMVHYTLNWVRL